MASKMSYILGDHDDSSRIKICQKMIVKCDLRECITGFRLKCAKSVSVVL